jgi:hypothetical protein
MQIEVFVHKLRDKESVRVTRYNTHLVEMWEEDTRIGQFYREWRQAIRPHRCAPITEDFAPAGDDVAMVNVVPKNPYDFQSISGRNLISITPLRRISDTKSPVIQRQLFNDLLHIKQLGEPLYQQVDLRTRQGDGCIESSSLCLMVPTIREDGCTQHVYSVMRRVGAMNDTMATI